MAPFGFFEKNSFSPHGSVGSFEGWVLLRISLGLAVRSFWSDLEKFPNRPLRRFGGVGSVWPEELFGVKKWSRKKMFCRGINLW